MKRRGIDWSKLSKTETKKLIYSDQEKSSDFWNKQATKELTREAIAMVKERIKLNRKLRRRYGQ